MYSKTSKHKGTHARGGKHPKCSKLEARSFPAWETPPPPASRVASEASDEDLRGAVADLDEAIRCRDFHVKAPTKRKRRSAIGFPRIGVLEPGLALWRGFPCSFDKNQSKPPIRGKLKRGPQRKIRGCGSQGTFCPTNMAPERP